MAVSCVGQWLSTLAWCNHSHTSTLGQAVIGVGVAVIATDATIHSVEAAHAGVGSRLRGGYGICAGRTECAGCQLLDDCWLAGCWLSQAVAGCTIRCYH